MSWGVAAQGVNFLLMPLLTRIYDPSQFGLFSIFSNVSVLLGVVAAMRYEFAIVLPTDDRDAGLVAWLAIDSALVFGLLLACSLGGAGPLLLRWRALAAIRPWIAWLPIAVVLLATYNAQAYWAIRKREYARLGFSKLVIALATGCIQLGYANLVGRGTGGLLAGLVAGQLAGMLYLARGSEIPIRLAGRWREIAAMGRRFSHFPKFSAPGSGLDGISQLLPVALLTSTFGPAVAGQFAIADRAMRMPSVLLGSSLAQVFFQRLSQSRTDPAECHRLLLKTWRHLAALGLVPVSVAMVLGPWLFASVFGARWREAGEIARALSPGVFAYFIAFPTSNVVVVFERVGLLLLWQLCYAGIVAASFLIVPAVLHLGAVDTVWTFSAALVVLHGASIALQWHVVGAGTPAPTAPATASGALPSLNQT
jgi:O-antigen/teichoic acid export membrane protein